MNSATQKMRLEQEAAWIKDALDQGASPAIELQLSVVGKRIGCRYYSSKNKTAWLQPYREHIVRDIHMYPGGNIMINGLYLKPDTPVWILG